MEGSIEHQHPQSAPGGISRCASDDALARSLAALSHPARIRILRHLSNVEGCCCKDVVDHMPLAQSTVSQHLKVMLEAGLIRMKPEGGRSCYTVDRAALAALSASVSGLLEACVARTASDQKS